MKPVLLDTGVIVALLDRSERMHATCVKAIQDLQAPMITCEAVIAESCYLMRRIAGAPQAILENIRVGLFQIPFDLSQSAAEVERLMHKYRSVPMDLADACLVYMANEYETGDILTLDGDFKVYRWGAKRVFQNLVNRA
jgi:predicted nucleic acid-binding protein